MAKQKLLHVTEAGSGQPLVLLHGIASSSRYWSALIDQLKHDYRVIAIDLLGFGRSPKPRSSYSLSEHAETIKTTLDKLGINELATVVGHSAGAIIAVALAINYPHVVKRLILVNMPVYLNETEAKNHIVHSSRLPKQLIYGPVAHVVCRVFCNGLRPLTRNIMPFYLKNLPKDVAKDSLMHTYLSYYRTLRNVLQNNHVQADLANINIPVELIYGADDPYINFENLEEISTIPGIRVRKVKGRHHLPINSPDVILEAIKA